MPEDLAGDILSLDPWEALLLALSILIVAVAASILLFALKKWGPSRDVTSEYIVHVLREVFVGGRSPAEKMDAWVVRAFVIGMLGWVFWDSDDAVAYTSVIIVIGMVATGVAWGSVRMIREDDRERLLLEAMRRRGQDE